MEKTRIEDPDSPPPDSDGPNTTVAVQGRTKDEETSPIGDLTGVRLGSILISSRLGAGGMGEVWRGFDETLEIDVAVKVLQPRLAQNPKYVRRFLREARAVARLDHPNIVRVYHARRVKYGENELRIMVMECIEGMDAHRARRQQPERRFLPEKAADITLQTARALQYAHKQGVIHRDIKPANIFICDADQSVKILDFGLAKREEEEDADDAHRTKIGILLGTPQYMGPEQILRYRADWRADIYSLGISFYEFLAGRVPFDGKDHLQVVRAHRDREITFPPELFDGIPPELIELIRGMCAKLPADRWGMPRVIRELSEFLGESVPVTLELPTRVPIYDITNIAARANSFVGRQSDLDTVLEMLRHKDCHLLTIVGPGGVGKTTLAREVARSLLGVAMISEVSTDPSFGEALRWRSLEVERERIRIAGGAWLIDLSDTYTFEGVLLAAGQALGISFPEEGTLPLFVKSLAERGPTLLIFDTCEQIADEIRKVIEAIAKGAPQTLAVVTTREALNVAGEVVYRVRPFDVHDVREAEFALQIFADRAKAARRDFEVTVHNRQVILEIVAALDGIALAIELAAARISTLSPEKILERLPRRLDILRSRRRDSSRRHATLRSTIEWSWRLLSLWEKLALVQCTLFRGGFFLDAAEAVVDLSPFPEAPFAIDAIEMLVEKNLLVVEDCKTVVGEGRYRLYDSVREYAREALEGILKKLGTGGTTTNFADVLKRRAVFIDDALEKRFVNFYVKYGEDQMRRWVDLHDPEALERLAIELENFDGRRQLYLASDPVSAARIAIVAETALRERGPSELRVPNLERAWDALAATEPVLRLRCGALRIAALIDTGRSDDARTFRAEVSAFANGVAHEHPELGKTPLVMSFLG